MTDIVSDVIGKQVTIDTPVEELAAAAREKGLEIKRVDRRQDHRRDL